EPVRGQPVVGVVVLYAGDPAEGEEAFRPLREFGPPGLDMVQPMPYVAVQQMIDAPNPGGRLNYWNADFYSELPDTAIDTFVERVKAAYGPEKFAKLQALKSAWDPTNLFCHNQNIPPAT